MVSTVIGLLTMTYTPLGGCQGLTPYRKNSATKERSKPMDSEKTTEFECGYEAGISYACRWIEEYMDARKGRLEPGKNQRKRDELELIKKTLIRYLDPKRPPK